MPKQKSQNEKAKTYFQVFEEERQIYRCKIENCDKKISAKNAFCFVSHLRHVHNNLYRDEINTNVIDAKSVAYKRLEMIQHCAEIVTVNGRPFSNLCDSGFHNLIRDKMDLLSENKQGIILNYPFTEIKQYIFATAAKIEEHIKTEVREKFIGAMIDIGSKNSWSFLSIHIQYNVNGRIKARNIGLKRMKKRHKSEYIEELLTSHFEKFGIDKLAIFSFTTDNASNMLATVRLFDDDIGDNVEENEYDMPDISSNASNAFNEDSSHPSSANIQHDLNIHEIRNLIQHQDISTYDEIDVELANILDDEGSFRDAMGAVTMNMARTTININSVPCSAHTLQLAVKDALKSNDATVKISLCRLAAKLLRRESNIYDLNEVGIFIKVVRVDCEVRWNSTYLMVTYNQFSPDYDVL